MEPHSPEKRPPSLYSQTPKVDQTTTAKKANLLAAHYNEMSGAKARNAGRDILRSSLDNPSFMEGAGGRPPSGKLNRDGGAKSTKVFAKMEDGISGRSVLEPAIMMSARGGGAQSNMDVRSRTELGGQVNRTSQSIHVVKKSTSTKTMGVPGYYVAKHGLPY